jgi:hypothetical protein
VVFLRFCWWGPQNRWFVRFWPREIVIRCCAIDSGFRQSGSEFRIVGGKTLDDNERLVQELIAVCPTFVRGGTMNPPFDGDGKVMLHVKYQVNRTVARCLCKIAFNYMALTCGETFALSSEFNELRKFIRNDVGDEAGRR